ncbi:unnamed protein product [marine sediment metagenome]|uniref:Uncharacterized protein n=1 Tax=marine sediment metagenome TaxID=412755 RepID=X0UEA9_9ZZZZ
MPETNEPTTSPPQPKEVCTIRIAFPVTSDEEAIKYKRDISGVLSDIPEVHIEFSIRSLPVRPPIPTM